jgi:hypothetical protein
MSDETNVPRPSNDQLRCEECNEPGGPQGVLLSRFLTEDRWRCCDQAACLQRQMGRRSGSAPTPDYDGSFDRLGDIIDEAFGMQPMMDDSEKLSFLERRLFEQRRGTSAPSPCADHVEGQRVRDLMTEHAREMHELARKLMYAEEKLRAALNKRAGIDPTEAVVLASMLYGATDAEDWRVVDAVRYRLDPVGLGDPDHESRAGAAPCAPAAVDADDCPGCTYKNGIVAEQCAKCAAAVEAMIGVMSGRRATSEACLHCGSSTGSRDCPDCGTLPGRPGAAQRRERAPLVGHDDSQEAMMGRGSEEPGTLYGQTRMTDTTTTKHDGDDEDGEDGEGLQRRGREVFADDDSASPEGRGRVCDGVPRGSQSRGKEVGDGHLERPEGRDREVQEVAHGPGAQGGRRDVGPTGGASREAPPPHPSAPNAGVPKLEGVEVERWYEWLRERTDAVMNLSDIRELAEALAVEVAGLSVSQEGTKR